MTNMTNVESTKCYYCSYCYSCDSCRLCFFCKNLRLTEYNIFCYSEKYGDKNSNQQEKYRVFNREVDENRYFELKELIYQIIPNPSNLKLNDFWESINQGQWRRLLEIPEAKDFKSGFEFISGQRINVNTDDTVITLNGKKYKLMEEVK